MTIADRPQPAIAQPRRISLPQCSHQPQPYTGPTKAQVLADRTRYLSPGIFSLYRDPLMVVEGYMQYVWDETGARYLDAYGGIVTISAGHCHPKIVAKVQQQLQTITHTTTLYLHPTMAQFAKKLAQHFPPESRLEQSYFTNSGSEANDLAILTAREFTGNIDIISLRNSYHGGSIATMGATATSNWKYKSNLTVGNKFATPGFYEGGVLVKHSGRILRRFSFHRQDQRAPTLCAPGIPGRFFGLSGHSYAGQRTCLDSYLVKAAGVAPFFYPSAPRYGWPKWVFRERR